MAEQITQEEDAQAYKGVFNISDIHKFKLATVDNIKTRFLLSLSDLNPNMAAEQLNDLLSSMQDILETYFTKEQITKYKQSINGKDFDFYQIKSLSAINFGDDMVYIRLAAENAFAIYNNFAKIIGVELPMSRTNFL